MTLNNLLTMSSDEIRQLRPFITNSTLNVGVHTAWNAFFDSDSFQSGNNASFVGRYVDQKAELILKMVGKFDETIKEEFLYFSEEPHLRYNEFFKRYRKTNIYMNAVFNFMQAYELLVETAYLKHLRDNKMLTLLILPMDSPSSANSPPDYSAYLEEFLKCESIIYLESGQKNTGHLQIPSCYEIDEKRLAREQLKDTANLEGLENLFSLLDVSTISLFGGEINHCLYHTERSLRFCLMKNIRVMIDLSSSNYVDRAIALLKFRPTGLVGKMGETSFNQMSALKDKLLDLSVDFSGLRDTIGKSPEEQIVYFQDFANAIRLANQIKFFYAYMHQDRAISDYNPLH